MDLRKKICDLAVRFDSKKYPRKLDRARIAKLIGVDDMMDGWLIVDLTVREWGKRNNELMGKLVTSNSRDITDEDARRILGGLQDAGRMWDWEAQLASALNVTDLDELFPYLYGERLHRFIGDWRHNRNSASNIRKRVMTTSKSRYYVAKNGHPRDLLDLVTWKDAFVPPAYTLEMRRAGFKYEKFSTATPPVVRRIDAWGNSKTLKGKVRYLENMRRRVLGKTLALRDRDMYPEMYGRGHARMIDISFERWGKSFPELEALLSSPSPMDIKDSDVTKILDTSRLFLWDWRWETEPCTLSALNMMYELTHGSSKARRRDKYRQDILNLSKLRYYEDNGDHPKTTADFLYWSNTYLWDATREVLEEKNEECVSLDIDGFFA